MARLPVIHNHGRWVAECPCGDAYQVAANHPGLPCGDQMVRLEWPAAVRAIEAALSARPYLKNRNWLPGETVADLWVENVRAGVATLAEVPDAYRAEVEARSAPVVVPVMRWRERADGTIDSWRLPGAARVAHLLPDVWAELDRLPVREELG